MKKIIRNILLSLLFVNLHVCAVTLESESLKDIYKYVDSDSVVVFDIDHTVIENTIDFDTWLPQKIKELQQQGLNEKDAVLYSLSMYYTFQPFINFYPIGGSKEVIADLQSKKIPVIALTNRSIPASQVTLEQMKKIDIDFSTTSLFDKDLNLAITHSGKFSEGIIFSGANDKGRMLVAFFDAIKYVPKKVIFIDDKLKYVKAVEREIEKRGIEYVGIRFSLQDKKKDSVNFDQLEESLYQLKVKIGLEPLSKETVDYFG
ncbi:DUF2608 domain-containing protein [Candidatus Babeliales bacterium]|nr:DUF2608 domain-containing protein [Candidatus Babeliales bacterium]